jgi:DNA-binding Lrp family transcriptional regulator
MIYKFIYSCLIKYSMDRRLDGTDIHILSLLYKNPTLTQVELAKILGLTQAAVSLRLKRLRELQIIKEAGYAVNPFDIGLEFACVDVHTNNPYEFASKFKYCPCIVNILSSDDKIFMLMASNSKELINCCVMKHINSDSNAIDVNFRFINDILEPISNTRYDNKHALDVTPCGDLCSECQYYIENGGKCIGCPITKFYKG